MSNPRLALCASIALVVVASIGCDSCKKKEETVKKETVGKTKSIDETPAPADLLVDLVIKDAEGLAKRAADGAGFGAELGPSPWEKVVSSVGDANAQKGLRA